MSGYMLFSIAIALSLDAFGVAVSIGLNRGIKFDKKLIFCMFFGFFQFFLSLAGALLGIFFNKYIATVPSIICGLVVSLVGLLMIREGFSEEKNNYILDPKIYMVLGISVSIDAAVVGFSILNKLHYVELIFDCIFIGITAFMLSIAGFLISKYLSKIKLISNYADYIGGIILILLGIKMMFT